MREKPHKTLSIHRLVELDVAGGRTDVDIQAELGIANLTLKRWRETDEYTSMMELVRRKSEQKVVSTTLAIKQKLSAFAGEAVDIIMAIARDVEQDGRTRVSAACEVLDRDGRFAKVSKMMNVQQGEDPTTLLPEETASQILAALAKVPATDKVQ